MASRNTVTGRGVASLLALGTGAVAHAHAGLPETSNVTVRRGHPEDFFVGASFGAVISRDSGQTWRWICPEAMGYGGWPPESFLWREAGDIIAATGSALLRSPDGGCSWNTHPYFTGNWVTALAAHPTDDRILYAVTGRTGQANGVYRSADGGETWEPTGLLRLGLVLNAVRVSPVDPRRLYASGEEAGRLLLWRSDDAGATWEELPHALPRLVRPYDLVVTAADPASADAVWVRVLAQGYTHLMRSDDGGRTLTPVHTLEDVFINMELSADGGTAWVGTLNSFFRGPRSGPLEMQPLPTGNACVLRTGSTLYACGSTWLHDWALARSSDEGTTWEPLFSLYGIQGPQQCPAGTPVRTLCPALWPGVADQLGAEVYPDGGVQEPPPPPPEDAGTPDAGSPGPDGGVAPPKSGGCGAASGNAAPALVLLSTLTLWRRGRRRSDAEAPMTMMTRKLLWTSLSAALLALAPGCDNDDPESQCGEPLYGGDATDEAWRTLVDAKGQPADSSQAVTLESPAQGQTYASTDAPPTWRWTSPLASLLPGSVPSEPSEPSRAPSRPRTGSRSMLAWLGNLLLPSAEAHLPPFTGDIYWVQVTVPGRECPVELLTSNLEWRLDTATWDTLRGAVDQDLSVQVTSAYLVQNRLREGPYRLEAPRTVRVVGAR